MKKNDLPFFAMREISHAFDGKAILKEVSLDVKQGEIVSLLGASGVGKTTLFNIAAGLLAADRGDVLFKGERINGQVGKIAYMLQKDLLLSHLTVEENVALPLLIRKEPKEKALAQARSLLQKFGLANYEKSYPSALSGGMAQRAAFLRTTFFASELLLLDEPFSALDAITKAQMHQWYLEFTEYLKLSTLLITHSLDEALYLSDRIYVLGNRPGEIIKEFAVPEQIRRQKEAWTEASYIQLKKELLDLLDSQPK